MSARTCVFVAIYYFHVTGFLMSFHMVTVQLYSYRLVTLILVNNMIAQLSDNLRIMKSLRTLW